MSVRADFTRATTMSAGAATAINDETKMLQPELGYSTGIQFKNAISSKAYSDMTVFQVLRV